MYIIQWITIVAGIDSISLFAVRFSSCTNTPFNRLFFCIPIRSVSLLLSQLIFSIFVHLWRRKEKVKATKKRKRYICMYRYILFLLKLQIAYHSWSVCPFFFWCATAAVALKKNIFFCFSFLQQIEPQLLLYRIDAFVFVYTCIAIFVSWNWRIDPPLSLSLIHLCRFSTCAARRKLEHVSVNAKEKWGDKRSGADISRLFS